MKIVNLTNPVRLSWLIEQGFRLDAEPFVSGAIERRKLVEQLPGWEPLSKLVRPGGIFHAGRVRRRWVTDPRHGVPFLSSTDILQADLARLGLVSRRSVAENPKLLIREGWTLITRSGSIGRMAYARRSMDGLACTEDVLRVVPAEGGVPSGYLYAFLSSRFGVPMVTGGTYGAIVQHIEPQHIADLPVPRLGAEVEGRVHALIEEAAELRSTFEEEVDAATRDLFESAGLSDLAEISWHGQGRDLGFPVFDLDPLTLRALNYAPRYTEIAGKISAVAHQTLGRVCVGGQLSRGSRFTRIPSAPRHGAKLIGQRQVFWSRPEGRWISTRDAPLGIFASDETVMVAAQGTLGENEVFCQAVLVTGRWIQFAYTEHLLRVVSGDPSYPGAYLFAFLRSPAAFRCLRSMSMGSKQQDLNEELLKRFPVPACTSADRQRIAERVRRAYRMRDEADEKDEVAYGLIEEAIGQAVDKAG